VEPYRNLHASAPRAYARYYADALGHLVQLRTADENGEAEVFDMAQHAKDLFREASLTDSDTLATVLVVIASNLLKAERPHDAVSPAVEVVGIRRPKWEQSPDQHAAALVTALRLASSCFVHARL